MEKIYLEFDLSGQVLSPAQTNQRILANSKNLYTAKFELNTLWSGLPYIRAIFTKADQVYEINIEDSECDIPTALYKDEGEFCLSLYGGDRATSTVTHVQVYASGYTDQTAQTDPDSPDITVLTPAEDTTISKIKFDNKLMLYTASGWKDVKNAYEYALAAGYEGSEKDFGQFLSGASAMLEQLQAYTGVHPGFSTLADELGEEMKYLSGVYQVAGIEVDMQAKTCQRIAASSCMIAGDDYSIFNCFGGRKRCNVTDSGAVTAYSTDEAYTETGFLTTAVTVGQTQYPIGTQVQVMVEQPKFYYRVVPLVVQKVAAGYSMTKFRLYISDSYKPGFKLHPAFVSSDGQLLDKIYLSAYEGAVYDSEKERFLNLNEPFEYDNSSLFSAAGQTVYAGSAISTISISQFSSMAQKRGTRWGISTADTLSVSTLLAVTEYSTLDIQSALGAGVTAGVLAQTGGTASLGNASGSDQTSSAVSYRGEENLYGNYRMYLDGLKTYNDGQLISVSVSLPEDEGQYENAGIALSGQSGYVTALTYSAEYDWLMLPAATSSTQGDSPADDSYTVSYTGQDGMLTAFGGRNDGEAAGLFCMQVVNSALPSSTLKARLVYR